MWNKMQNRASKCQCFTLLNIGLERGEKQNHWVSSMRSTQLILTQLFSHPHTYV